MAIHRWLVFVRALLTTTLLAAVLVTASLLQGQGEATSRDSGRVLLFELQFSPDSTESVVAVLERGVVYWAELTGPGTLAFQPVRRRGRPAFLVPDTARANDHHRRFEVYAVHAGPHAVTVSERPPGSAAGLRLYRDVIETRRIVSKLDRQPAIGVVIGGGLHSGYRLHPTSGADADRGQDVEGCVLAETGGRFGTCLGVGRQTLPGEGLTATWIFIEQRGGLVSARWVGGRRTDLGASLRYGQVLSAGTWHRNPGLAAFGLYVTQHFPADGRRRGLSAFCAWQHGRLVNTVETERRDTDRFTVGLIWLP